MTTPQQRARLLVVDDDPTAREGLAELLRGEGYQVLTASDGERALQKLAHFSPDLIVTDLSMPRMGGFGLVQCVRQRAQHAQTPIIVVSARSEIDQRVHGFEFGADDFLAKPVDLDELTARIERHLSRAREHRETARLSVSDDLTGMLNRRGIRNFYARALHECLERKQPISVLTVDLDSFKPINDRYGHATGDTVLCLVARTLQDAVRASDRVGRLGGDEFLVVLPGASREACIELEARLQSGLPIKLRLSEGTELTVTFSSGSATAQGEEIFEAVTQRADDALYAAKSEKAARLLQSGVHEANPRT